MIGKQISLLLFLWLSNVKIVLKTERDVKNVLKVESLYLIPEKMKRTLKIESPRVLYISISFMVSLLLKRFW